MKRSELGLIPLTYPMPTGNPPIVNRLGIFGTPSPAIGTVVCAISTIDVNGGWVPDGSGGLAPEKPPQGIKWWHVLIACFPIAPFAGILGAIIGSALSPSPIRGEAAFDLTTPGGVLFAAAAIAITLWFASRPNLPFSMGQSIVVGTEGFDEGHYSQFGGGGPQRGTFRYDDRDQAWTLKAVVIASGRGAGHATEELKITDVKTGEARLTLSRDISRDTSGFTDPFKPELEAAFARILDSATRVRVALAETARRAGQPVVFPVLEGQPRRLLLTAEALEDHHGGQVRKLPLSRLRVSVDKGVYNFSADDGAPPILLERHRIGDVFVFETLLKLRG
jgi:hypothetical protein